MPRKGTKKKQVVAPNLDRLINKVMRDGKKRKAAKIVNTALDYVIKNMPKGYEMPEGVSVHMDSGNEMQLKMALIDEIVENVRPLVMVKSQRIGGANLQVPRDVPFAEGISTSLRWIVNAARTRGIGAMSKKLADEFLDILQKRGGALRKKEESFKMAMANRVFSTAR